MNSGQYICFCQKVFPDQTAFKDHLPCIELVNSANKTARFDIVPKNIKKEFRVMQRPCRPETAVIKIIKLAEVEPEEKEPEKLIPAVSTHLGKRLPSRTKVPYLSRAVPLSTDHSFERCTCGAVFVTRVGKRQHQARFCKLAKNKTKNKCSNDLNEVLMENVQTISVSVSELGDEFTESDDSVINDIYNEQSVIQYEVE